MIPEKVVYLNMKRRFVYSREMYFGLAHVKAIAFFP